MFEFLGEKLQLWGSSISARTKHRSQSSAINRKIEDLEPVVEETYMKLGAAFYEAAKDNVPEQFSSYFKVITDALREIETNKGELERLKAAYDEKKQELEEKKQDVKTRQKEEAARKKEEARKRKEEEALQKEELSRMEVSEAAPEENKSAEEEDLFEHTGEDVRLVFDEEEKAEAKTAEPENADGGAEMTEIEVPAADEQETEESEQA